jgi:hypothetical protein
MFFHESFSAITEGCRSGETGKIGNLRLSRDLAVAGSNSVCSGLTSAVEDPELNLRNLSDWRVGSRFLSHHDELQIVSGSRPGIQAADFVFGNSGLNQHFRGSDMILANDIGNNTALGLPGW